MSAVAVRKPEAIAQALRTCGQVAGYLVGCALPLSALEAQLLEAFGGMEGLTPAAVRNVVLELAARKSFAGKGGALAARVICVVQTSPAPLKYRNGSSRLAAWCCKCFASLFYVIFDVQILGLCLTHKRMLRQQGRHASGVQAQWSWAECRAFRSTMQSSAPWVC